MHKEILANATVATSAGVVGVTWITQLNEILQLGLTAASIVGVVYAIAWHRTRIRDSKRKNDE